MKDLYYYSYNEAFRHEYEQTGNIEALGKYIISETIPPIEDFQNAVNIIRSNYCRLTNSTLLIVGAHLFSEWLFEKDHNELLEILNCMYQFLPLKEKAIVSFLNANHLRQRDKNYRTNPEYEKQLLASLADGIPFVYNRVSLAELYTGSAAKQMYEDALRNVIKVSSLEECQQMSTEQFLEPKAYINEHILGTHISSVNYKVIIETMKKRLEGEHV